VRLMDNPQSPKPASTSETEVIKHLEQAITNGKHWYIALLEAICSWKKAKEDYNERTYHYLIAGEAFDWLLLAERLCAAVDGLLPANEKINLLFHGKPPLDLTKEEFKKLIGNEKYHQYLNYFYGITTEEALIHATREEIRKERGPLGRNNEHEITNDVYQRIYGARQDMLLKRFRQEKSYPQLRSISLTELKEFTYWLFKYRLEHCDKAKVASDTKKALNQLNSYSFPGKLITNKE